LACTPTRTGTLRPGLSQSLDRPAEDVDEKGNVRFGYEAGVVTTRRGWAVKPYPTSQYASGAGLLFESDDYGPDFMLDCLEWPSSGEASAAMFNRYGDMQQRAFNHARRLGIKTCVGTELPLGVPKALASRLEARGLKPEDPAVIRRLYEGTFLRLVRKMPIDYYWLWTPEIWLGKQPGCKVGRLPPGLMSSVTSVWLPRQPGR